MSLNKLRPLRNVFKKKNAFADLFVEKNDWRKLESTLIDYFRVPILNSLVLLTFLLGATPSS